MSKVSQVEKTKKFLTQLGCKNIKLKPNGWINSSCPLAKWDHTSGTDSHPSFGIYIVAGKKPKTKCFTCSTFGTPIQLLWKIAKKSGRDLSHLVPLITIDIADAMATDTVSKKLETLSYGMPKPINVAGIDLSAAQTVNLENLKETFLPEEDLVRFQDLSKRALYYLMEDRGMTLDAIKFWELGWHPGANRIAIPVRNCNKKLVGLTGHRIDKRKERKYIHSKGFNRDLYLYGEHLIEEGKPGIITEGFFDVISLYLKGYRNVVALFGTHLSKVQSEKIVKFFDSAIIMMDGDEAGRNAAAIADKVLRERIHTVVPNLPEGSDPDSLSVSTLENLIGPPEGQMLA